MLLKAVATVAAIASGVAAQRPNGTSICDYYTTALLMNNTAANQKALLTLVVNTAVIGNYTKPNVGIKVAGILAPGTFNGTQVNLLPYFNGGLASSNRGGSSGVAVNFLDGGGAAPLMQNKPAQDTSSNQYILLTHLYEYFGALLGCSMMGNSDYPAYNGQASQYNVHKFMALTPAEVGYFTTQVAQSAASFGVAASDLEVVGNALNTFFNVKCAAPTTVIPAQGPQLQSICIDASCPLAANNTCAAYNGTVMKPSVANSTLAGNGTSGGSGSSTTAGGSGGSGASPTASGSASKTSSPATASAAAGNILGFSFAAVAGGLFALVL